MIVPFGLHISILGADIIVLLYIGCPPDFVNDMSKVDVCSFLESFRNKHPFLVHFHIVCWTKTRYPKGDSHSFTASFHFASYLVFLYSDS